MIYKNKRMTIPEMNEFIGNVGRSELFEEARQMQEDIAWHHQTDKWGAVKSRYLKAVCASLVALGYDEKWVDGEFRSAFEKWYFNVRNNG